jgi:predicted DNA-binding transcriptional regulator AlpA
MTKLLRFRDLVDMGVVNNRMTLSRWIEKHAFPKPVKLGPNTAAWPADQIEAWVASRAEPTKAA